MINTYISHGHTSAFCLCFDCPHLLDKVFIHVAEFASIKDKSETVDPVLLGGVFNVARLSGHQQARELSRELPRANCTPTSAVSWTWPSRIFPTS